jgi:hypothetical protein
MDATANHQRGIVCCHGVQKRLVMVAGPGLQGHINTSVVHVSVDNPLYNMHCFLYRRQHQPLNIQHPVGVSATAKGDE